MKTILLDSDTFFHEYMYEIYEGEYESVTDFKPDYYKRCKEHIVECLKTFIGMYESTYKTSVNYFSLMGETEIWQDTTRKSTETTFNTEIHSIDELDSILYHEYIDKYQISAYTHTDRLILGISEEGYLHIKITGYDVEINKYLYLLTDKKIQTIGSNPESYGHLELYRLFRTSKPTNCKKLVKIIGGN